jgi:O-antigen/teichoic acid export membrane protein
MMARLPPTVWVTAEKIFTQVFGILVFAVQAPILGPHAFGVIAVVMVFVGFWEAVPGVGFIDALLSIRGVEPQHFTTVTTVCTLICIGFGVAIFGFAGPLTTSLGDPQLAPVMRAMAVLPLIHAFSIAPTAAAEGQLRFRSTALRTTTGLFAGGVVGLALTVAGAGVWALVFQGVVQRVVAAVVLWLAVPTPFRFGISPRHLREVASFAWPVIFARTMSWSAGQVPRLILGFYVGPTELGLFTLATRLNDIVLQIAVGPGAVVARVDLRRFESVPDLLGKAVRRVFRHISFVTFPLCVGGAVVAPTLFHAWLNPRWYDAIVPSQIMLLLGMLYVTIYGAAVLLLAINRQKWEAVLSTAHCLGIMIVVAIAGPYGITAAAGAIAALSLAMLPLPIIVMRRQSGIAYSDILVPQLAPLVGACVMGGVLLLLRPPIEAALASATALAVEIFLGACLYAVPLVIMMPAPAAQAFRLAVSAVRAKRESETV